MQQVQNEAYSLTDELRRIQKDEQTSAAQRAVRAPGNCPQGHRDTAEKDRPQAAAGKEFRAFEGVQIGQEVVIADLGQTRRLSPRGLTDRNGMVEVRAGIMKNRRCR